MYCDGGGKLCDDGGGGRGTFASVHPQRPLPACRFVDVTNGFSGHCESRLYAVVNKRTPTRSRCVPIFSLCLAKRGRLWIDRTRAVWTTMQSLTSLFHSLMLDAGVRRRFDE
ncbi:conserved hypothetical protein [Trichinella spiralis]|uniref:hypothetical protein n=1 Tax=Trichinella spiralis TaxID=6334 RepID=UPI0001EFD198|nr:conserved hypothetical protein [Trichinella spiralis]